MLSDSSIDQRDFSLCGHCGATLLSRFAFCPGCHGRTPVAQSMRFEAPMGMPMMFSEASALSVPRAPSHTGRSSSQSLRKFAYPYAVVEESELDRPLRQRLRQPLALAVSVLVATSAVYLGFIHRDDAGIGEPIGVSGAVRTQTPAQTFKPGARQALKPSVTPAQRGAATLTAKRIASAVAASAPLVATSFTSRSDTPAATGNPRTQAPEKARTEIDVSRHLRAARANLQNNNLSATRTRLAAAIAAQPRNRDALNLRATLAEREQQRDALLSLARGCGYIERWNCVSHTASDALAIDASSQEAHRLVTLATHESELASVPVVEPTPPVVPQVRDPNQHH